MSGYSVSSASLPCIAGRVITISPSLLTSFGALSGHRGLIKPSFRRGQSRAVFTVASYVKAAMPLKSVANQQGNIDHCAQIRDQRRYTRHPREPSQRCPFREIRGGREKYGLFVFGSSLALWLWWRSEGEVTTRHPLRSCNVTRPVWRDPQHRPGHGGYLSAVIGAG